MEQQQKYSDYLQRRSSLSYLVRRFFVMDLVRHFDGQVLDVGCGIGEFLSRYPRSYGVDINPFLVRHCIEQGFRANLSDIFHLPFTRDIFDGVLISNVIEHLHDVDAAFKEATRVLRPGGRLVITCPFEAGFRHDPTHVSFIKSRDLQTLAGRNDLKVERIYSYPPLGLVFGKLFYFYELRAVFTKK